MRDHDGMQTVVGDALAIPFPDASFDFVSSCLFMHHLSPDDAVRSINEALRVCRYGVLINDLDRRSDPSRPGLSGAAAVSKSHHQARRAGLRPPGIYHGGARRAYQEDSGISLRHHQSVSLPDRRNDMEVSTQFDVIVVGSGPAGSASAIAAADRGLRVLLLEATRFPRHKVCGEFVSAESAEVLRYLLRDS